MNYTISNLRAFAIILIILGHSIIIYSSHWGAISTSTENQFFGWLQERVISPIQLPIFFFVSGYLFHKTIIKKKFTQVIKDKARRLIIPYFVIAMAYMNPIKILLSVPGYENFTNIKHTIIQQLTFFGYASGHLWFLPTLFLLFTTLYYPFKWSNSLYKSILLLIICFCLTKYVTPIVASIKYLQFNQYILYLLPFTLGYATNYLQLYINKRIYIILSFILFISYIIFPLYSYYIVMLLLFCLYFSIPNIKIKYVDAVSKNSFGLYLFHSPLIYITFTFLKDSSPIWVFLINFICFGGGAYILTDYIKKSKYKWIIGE